MGSGGVSVDIKELSRVQLDELREAYLWGTDNDYVFAHEIPDDVIFEHYGEICFVDDDFLSFIASQPMALPF